MIRKDGFSIGFSAALGTIVALIFLYALNRFAEAALGIATPFLAAFAIALMLDPLVTRLQKNPLFRKRFPAVLVVFLLFLLGFGGLMTYLVPSLIDQTQRLVRWFTPVTYKIRRAARETGKYRTIASDVGDTTYVVKGLENGTRVYFTVLAQGTGSPDNAAADVELPVGPPVLVTVGRHSTTPTPHASPTPPPAGKVTVINSVSSGKVNSDGTHAAPNAVPPGTVEATSGDGQVTLSWQPPPETESGFDRLRSQVDDFLAAHRKIGPVTLPENLEALTGQYSEQASGALKLSASRIAGLILASASKLIYVILIPIVTFYLLLDLDRLKGRFLFLLPATARDTFRKMSGDVGEVFGSYVRGMLTVSFMYGVTAVIVFFLCGLKSYAVLLGVAAGLLYTVPFVGPMTTAVLAAVVSLATGHDITHTGWVLLAALAQNQFFDNVVVPRVIGHSVGLHPLVTLTALFMGGEMFGIWGMLLSVPVAASIQVVMFRLFPKLSAPTPLAVMMGRKNTVAEPLPGANAAVKDEDVASDIPIM